MSAPIVQRQPFVVPTTDGKLIEEHFGGASLGSSEISIAHMVAPPQWSEPHQNPEFDEYTLMVSGRKQVEVDGKAVVVGPFHVVAIGREQSVDLGQKAAGFSTAIVTEDRLVDDVLATDDQRADTRRRHRPRTGRRCRVRCRPKFRFRRNCPP